MRAKTGGSVPVDVRERLEQELEELRTRLELGHELHVVWSPKVDSVLSGEVIGDVICIYEPDVSKALEVLQHEFLDYCVSQVIQPYKEIANLLIKKMNDDAYGRKEKTVEALRRLLDKNKESCRP